MLPRLVCILTAWLLFATSRKLKSTSPTQKDAVTRRPAQRAYIGFYYEDFLAVNGPDSFQQVAAF